MFVNEVVKLWQLWDADRLHFLFTIIVEDRKIEPSCNEAAIALVSFFCKLNTNSRLVKTAVKSVRI